MAQWTIHAAYDPEAHIWYTLDSDLPGLVTSGRTIEELRERAALIIPDLLEVVAELTPDSIELEKLQGTPMLHLVQ